MARVDPATSRIAAYRHRASDPRTLSGNAVEALAFTPDGILWVGTSSGLNAFDPATGLATRILREPGRGDGLPDNWVPDLLVARDGRLWVATQAGACRLLDWDGRTARFEAVAPRLGRLPAPVESLIEDAGGRIWLGPRLRLDPRTWQAEEFGPADGCAFRNFFIASRARCADGRLLFGSPEGLLLVQPGELRPWTFQPPLAVSSLRIDGVEGPLAPGELQLRPGQRGFQLEVAALDYTDPPRNRYRHRLEGLEPAWIEEDAAHRSLAYAGLRPGRYVLRVEGTNRAGRWSPAGLSLPVRVLPAFHQTAWFRLLGAVAGLAAAYGAFRWRVRSLEARSRLLEATVSARTRDLAAANVELAKAQEKIAQLMANTPDLLENLDGWVARMAGDISEFAGGCRITALAYGDSGCMAYGSKPERLPSLGSLAEVKVAAFAPDGRFILPARGPSGEALGAVVAEGGSISGNVPVQQLLEGFAHQFGAALDMIRVRARLHAVEATQARTLQEFHARGIPTLQVCTRCGACCDHTHLRCPADGARLEIPRALPYRFLGRYRFLRRLGTGGMGSVFEAEDEKLARRVAIKLIRPELVNETAYRLRFEREAQAIAKVEHPGVVTLYDSGSTGDGQLYLIMEHLRGMDVAAALRAFGRAHPVQAARFIRQGTQALQAAHEAAVIHRDLKPQNIFLVPHATEGFQVKILDFGLAKSTDADVQLTGTGMLLGTPAYMAPEQVRRGQADARTDLYAFAAVAYEVLTRRPLVPAERVSDFLRGAWNPAPPPPSTLVPVLGREVDALFAQALATDPDHRPGNAAAWGEALARGLEAAQGPGGWPEVMPLAAPSGPFRELEPDPPTRASEEEERGGTARA
jgi:tRNA A-37 threonylcarbamoyl transferase component Bud32